MPSKRGQIRVRQKGDFRRDMMPEGALSEGIISERRMSEVMMSEGDDVRRNAVSMKCQRYW